MAPKLFIYDKAVPVSSNRHADLCVTPVTDYRFANHTVCVPLTCVEFSSAATCFPIVFSGSKGHVMPLAVMGLEKETNLFIDKNGAWTGEYLPAFFRQYPFVFTGNPAEKTLTLCIDESFSGCNTKGLGDRLFDSQGKATRYLNQVLEFLKRFQTNFQMTQVFCRHLEQLNLLEEMDARFTAGSGTSGLTGFMTVNREKLKSLDEKALLGMFRSDELEMVHVHLHSLSLFHKLTRKLM